MRDQSNWAVGAASTEKTPSPDGVTHDSESLAAGNKFRAESD